MSAEDEMQKTWDSLMENGRPFCFLDRETKTDIARRENAEDAARLRWLISIGARVRFPNGNQMSMDEPLFRNALDLAIALAKSGE